MTRDDIIRMAREAGLCDEEGRDDSSVIIENHLKRFAALVLAAKREACESCGWLCFTAPPSELGGTHER